MSRLESISLLLATFLAGVFISIAILGSFHDKYRYKHDPEQVASRVTTSIDAHEMNAATGLRNEDWKKLAKGH